MTVSLRRVDGREQSFRIVGEDEADPSHGTLSSCRRSRGPF
jgi:transcription elongation GreA/GreB family factor